MTADCPDKLIISLAEFVIDLRGAERPMQPSGIRLYLRGLHSFLAWYRANRREHFCVDNLAAVTDEEITEYARYLAADLHRRANTVSQYLLATRAFVRWLGKQYQLQSTVIPKIRAKPMTLSTEEEQHFLAALHSSGSYRDIALVELVLGTGLRAAEVLALELANLNLNEGGATLAVGKDGVSQRILPLSKTVQSALVDYLTQERPVVPREPHLFLTTKQGKPIGYPVLYNIIARYAQLAGIARCSARTLRNTFAKHYVEAGVSHGELAALLGVTYLSPEWMILLTEYK